MLVSRHPELLEFARGFRNYGKPDHAVHGLNFRMSEFTAALGVVQAERMEEIVAFKNAVAREHLDPSHPARLRAARRDALRAVQVHRLRSELERSTGKVYDQPCHRILGHAIDLPNSDWVAPQPLVRAAVLPPGARPRAPVSATERSPRAPTASRIARQRGRRGAPGARGAL